MNLNSNEKKDENEKDSHLTTLNSRQKAAVLKTEGALLILAGAGAGKTKTVTHRILHLIKNNVRPSSILAITFTNKAAKEMRERLRKLLDEDAALNRPVSMDEYPHVSTFHSLGVHIIKEQSSKLGLPRHFTIFDRSDSKSAVKQAVEGKGLDPKQFEPGKILGVISKYKGEGVRQEDFSKEAKGYFESIVNEVWEVYEKILWKEKALDFDDLLLKTRNLLLDPLTREHYQNIWKYIHVDEYQDTNRVQYEITKLLAERDKNIAVVGDLDQAIYGWRGADYKNIMRFEKDYPESLTILLEENYRSTKNIIAVANSIIEKNEMRKKKTLFTENPEGDLLSIYGAGDEKDEASYIARTSKMLISQGVKPQEIAVLYRANFQSRSIEEAFLRNEINYELLGTKFFERKEVKDVLSYIKLALNPDSLSDLKRAINSPSRGIGKVTLLKIFEGKEEELPKGALTKVNEFREFILKVKEKVETNTPSEVVKFIILEGGFEKMFREEKKEDDLERLENVRELVTVAESYDQFEGNIGIEKFLEHASLASDQDDIKEEKNGVRLMTVHASKGLEFDYVFITGLEENLFPHKRLDRKSIGKEEEEEERRLFYVALTRARLKLYLTHTSLRTIFGSKQFNLPSEFLTDIDDEFLFHENGDGSTKGEKIIYLDF